MIDPASLLPSLKYIGGFDNLGYPKILDQPAHSGFLQWNGGDFFMADGSAGLPIILDQLQVWTNASPSLPTPIQVDKLFGQSDGKLFALEPELSVTPDVTWFATFTNGEFAFIQISTIGVPVTGFGLVVRQGTNGANPASVPPAFLLGPGIPLLDQYGGSTLITSAVEGQVLTIQSGVPVFKTISSGSATAGGSPGLGGVSGASTSVTAVTVTAYAVVLMDVSGDAVTITNFNQSADITASGVSGLDTGSEAASTWYYCYAIYNGSTSKLLISASATTPTLPSGYTYYSLVSLFYNDASSNIVAYVQRGRKFWTAFRLWGDNINAGTGLAVVSAGTNINTLLPPIVASCSGIVGGGTGQVSNLEYSVASDSNGTARQTFYPGEVFSTASPDGFKFNMGNFIDLPIVAPGSAVVYWQTSTATTKGRIGFTGYSI